MNQENTLLDLKIHNDNRQLYLILSGFGDQEN